MKNKQTEIMHHKKGFVAALDQSGGSTPKALEAYGVSKESYADEGKMFDLVHEMRSRIITSPSFVSDFILGAILFEQTMDRTIQGMLTADFLWEKKGIIPFLKIDKGLDTQSGSVQMMRPITGLDSLLHRAVECKIFGTKMRAVIKGADAVGIKQIVDQQFEYGKQILAAGLVPIIEPEVDINIPDKHESELLLKAEIQKHLELLPMDTSVILKLTIPFEDGFYSDFTKNPRIMRVVALSGGYSRKEACARLARNPGLIASFSRALTEGLNVGQTDDEYNALLKDYINMIYKASIT